MRTYNNTAFFLKSFLLSVILGIVTATSVHAIDGTPQTALEELKANQAKVVEAQATKDAATKTRDALLAQQATKPNPDTERKLKDAEYEVMMADRKLSSATKAVERVQKKLDEAQGEVKVVAPAVKIEKPTAANEDLTKKAAEDLARKEAEAKLAAQKAAEESAKKAAEAKLAAQKAAEEQARKDAEAKLAAQRAAEEAAKKAAEAEAAKKQALAAELGIDKNCIALPAAPTNPSASLNEAEQAYAQGFLKQINLLVAKKTADDVAPISPSPVLEGSKLSPCDPDQKLALKFGYMGNGQYRVETRVLAGDQVFSVKNVVQPLNRTIPESDNGELYVFFLDGREGRTKLTAYKKSLLGQDAAQ